MNRLFLPFAAIAIASPAEATIINLTAPRNTGVNGSGVPLGTGAADPHYAWVGTPPSGGATPVVMDHGAFPVPPWLGIAAGPSSRWIAPTTNATGNAGNYTYRTTFTIPAGVDPTQVYLRGRWAVDDPGAVITVNGTPTGITNSSGFTTWSDFAIQRGLVSGVNTIDFTVPDAGGCCTGLRVEFNDARGGAPGQVPIPGLMNSGVTTIDGTALPNGSAAPGAWASTLSFPGVNPVYAAGAGVIPSPPWIAPSSDSAWLTLAPNDTNAPPGTAWVSIPFDLTGLDTSTVHIFGRWTADNIGHDIYLNGVATGNAQVGSFPAWSDFSISVADGDTFLPGINYLTFQVENLPPGANPAGLRWEILSATAAVIPEPSTFAVLTLAGLISFRRRRA